MRQRDPSVIHAGFGVDERSSLVRCAGETSHPPTLALALAASRDWPLDAPAGSIIRHGGPRLLREVGVTPRPADEPGVGQ